MRFYAAVLAALFAWIASAQFSETMEVRLLEIEATVVDRAQHTVDGLTSEDFVVTIGGKPAGITSFSFIARGLTRDTTGPAGEAAVGMPVPTKLIIVVDDLHLHPDSKRRALTALRQYVEDTMDPATTVTLLTWNGALTTRTVPTSRRGILMSAIDASMAETPRAASIDAERKQLLRVRQSTGATAGYRRMVENYADSRAEDVDRTLTALERVIGSAFATSDGRKILLFLSEGFPVHPGADMLSTAVGAGMPPFSGARYHKGQRLEELAERTRAAGVTFSTLDPSGAGSNTRNVRDNAHEGVFALARETGGIVIADQNDLGRALAQLDERMSTYYSLAVRVPDSKPGAKVEVRVRDQPKLRVHTALRSGMASRDEALATAVRAQLSRRSEDNPLEARFFVEVDSRENGCIASMQFLVPAEKLTLLAVTEPVRGQLDVWFAVADQEGFETPVRTRAVAVTSKHGQTIGHSQPIALSKGRYVISTAVVDRLSGATSYLQRDVECGH